MKRFLITFAAVIAAHIFLSFLAMIVLTSILGLAMMGTSTKVADVAPGSYLVQDVPAELPEFVPESSIPFPRRPTSHTDLLENLEKARADERIEAVLLRVEMLQAGWGKLEELRQSIQALRESGKPVIAFTTFATNKTLYLASACDSIFVHPKGYVHLSGLNAERIFLRNLLDKLDVRTQVSQIKEYKAMAEMVMREEMSPEVRQNVAWILDGVYDEYLRALADDRGVGRDQVVSWLETCQFDAQAAADAGIVDGLRIWEDLERRMSASIEGRQYAEIPRARLGLRGRRIAVIHGCGTITQGENGWVFPLGETMGDETMVAALEEARDDDGIAGVLLRLDTGGGLSTASERIGLMVEDVARRKPVVISMVDLTASGGYMISHRCSTLVALPTSVVGSIGSINMRANLAGLLEQVGVTVDRVTKGPHATTLSAFADLTEEEFARLETIHWKTYRDWIRDVAKHRGMSVEEVNALARGQVFTGRQALDNGLIDVLGGFDAALEILREQVGIPPGEDVSFLHLPREKSFIEKLAEGEWGGAARSVLGRRPTEEEVIMPTVRFWKSCLDGNESLALFWWRF